MKKRNKTIIVTVVILVIVFIAVCVLWLINSNKKYELNSSEAVAYTSLRLAISKSALDGTGEISKEYLNRLKDTVKNFNKEETWFNDYSDNFYGLTKDTSENRIDIICNSNYCAKFTIEYDNINYYLIDYSFEVKNEQGYLISIIE